MHEFVYKLSSVASTLYTEAARRIGEGRHDYMMDFFQRLEDEVRGKR